MFSLLKKIKKPEDLELPQEPSEKTKKKEHEDVKDGEIDYAKLLEDVVEEPEKTERTPEPVSAPAPTEQIKPTNEIGFRDQNYALAELKEALSGIYMLLEKQNKILENIAGFQTTNKHDTELDEIDNSIIKLLEQYSELDARKLQKQVSEEKICSISTLFLHLKKLVRLGIVKKSRKKQFMIYSLAKKPENIED
jgi:uncharacterized membrane protein